MWGEGLDALVVVRSAAALLAVLAGCAGSGAEGRALSPPVPPVASTPVAPDATPVSDLASDPGAPLPVLPSPPAIDTATTVPPADGSTTVASGTEPSVPDKSPAALPEPPAASTLVSLVDELPFRHAVAEVTESPARDRHHAKRKGHHHRPYHPAPGIIVDVVDARGGAAAADLQRVARNIGYWPFRRCYEEGLRRDQRLGGKVPLELQVDPSGTVERAAANAATVADPSVVTCVAREALHLPLVPGESPTQAKLVVTLATGDEPVPVPRPVPGADDLRQALRGHWPEVEQCYASDLPRHPDAGGRMELRFRLNPSGEVAEVAEGDTRFGDADVTRCVLGVYRTTGFPALRGAPRDGTFVYAMHFEPRSNVLPVQ
jgi:hypothetical protein